MKKLILSMMLVLAMATSGWATAYDFDLINANGTIQNALPGYTGAYAEVTIDASGHVIFAGDQGVVFGDHTYYFFLNKVDLNLTNDTLRPTSITTSGNPMGQSTPTYAYTGADGNVSEFGTFNFSVGSTGNQGANDSVQQVSFDLSDTVTLLTNNKGYEAAAHMFIFQDGTYLDDVIATGFVGNGNNPVPEPGTMMLLGVGMFGLAVFGKRRMSSKEA